MVLLKAKAEFHRESGPGQMIGFAMAAKEGNIKLAV